MLYNETFEWDMMYQSKQENFGKRTSSTLGKSIVNCWFPEYNSENVRKSKRKLSMQRREPHAPKLWG